MLLTGAAIKLDDVGGVVRGVTHQLVVDFLRRRAVPLGVVAAAAPGALTPERAIKYGKKKNKLYHTSQNEKER